MVATTKQTNKQTELHNVTDMTEISVKEYWQVGVKSLGKQKNSKNQATNKQPDEHREK